jgi:hypothetical protein
VGEVILLVEDPRPPALPPEKGVAELEDHEAEELCGWVRLLERPEIGECGDRVGVNQYFSVHALELACDHASRAASNACAATVRDIAACAMQVLDCATSTAAPGGCAALVSGECAPPPPVD